MPTVKDFQKFSCPECHNVTEYLLLHGYYFGDRLLEEVFFEVRKSSKGKWLANIQSQDKEYFKDLNEKKWLREAIKFASDNENDEILDCPNCKCGVVPEEDLVK